MTSCTRLLLVFLVLTIIQTVHMKFIELERSKRAFNGENPPLANPGKYCLDANCERADCALDNQENCYGYIRCVKNSKGLYGYAMPCAFGLFWDPDRLNCNHINEIKNGCKYDPCMLDQTLESHQNPDDGCEQYYKCVTNQNTGLRESKPQCCLHGEKYQNGVCVQTDDPKCEWACPALYASPENYTEPINSTTTPATVTECLKKEIAGVNGMSYIDENNQTKPCSPGTIFNSSACHCIKDDNYIPPRKCKSEVLLKFDDNSANRWSVENHGTQQFWIGRHNLKTRGGNGIFNLNTRLYIPSYDQSFNLAQHFTIQFVFRNQYSKPLNQTIVSNCVSTERRVPPIAIMANSVDRLLYFFVDDKMSNGKEYNAKFSLPYEISKENYVYYTWDGHNLQATVTPLSKDYEGEDLLLFKSDTKAKSKTVQIRDKTDSKMVLPVSYSDFTIGSCVSGDYTRGFEGYLAQFEITSLKGNC